MAVFKTFNSQDIIVSPLEVNKGFTFYAPPTTTTTTTTAAPTTTTTTSTTTTTTTSTTSTTTAAPTTSTTTTAAPTTTTAAPTTTTAAPTTTTAAPTTTTAAPTTTTTTTATPTTTTTTTAAPTTTTTTASPAPCTIYDVIVTQEDLDDATGNNEIGKNDGTLYVDYIACDGTPTTTQFGGAGIFQICVQLFASPLPDIYIYINNTKTVPFNGSSVSDTSVVCT
jgi:hypothetical protein